MSRLVSENMLHCCLTHTHAADSSVFSVTQVSDFSSRAATNIISNVMKEPKRSIQIPNYKTKSKYSKEWEPYVAANLYLYVVPLALFLRRARELDFSSNQFHKSVQHVERVFRVFSPGLLEALSTLCQRQSPWNYLVQRHVEILGDFAPPSGPITMSSLRTDMICLLEEVQTQHIKTIREMDTFTWIADRLENMLGQGTVHREKVAIASLLENARSIVNLPADFQLASAEGSRSSKSTAVKSFRERDTIYRDENGELTAAGREALLSGALKIDAVVFNSVPSDRVHDTLHGCIMTYELEPMVKVTTRLSDWLNNKFGLPLSPSGGKWQIRFNLRFLADYRNLLVSAVVLYALSNALP